jgi:hypothetical protein
MKPAPVGTTSRPSQLPVLRQLQARIGEQARADLHAILALHMGVG